MGSTFWAHSGTKDDTRDRQELAGHVRFVDSMAQSIAGPIGVEKAPFCAGQLHDLGKNHPTFQRWSLRADVRIDHSTAVGAILLRHNAPRYDGRRRIERERE